MYADITVTTKHSSSHEVQAESKRQISSRQVAKAAKQAKKEKDATDDATGEGPAPKGKALNKTQRGRLAKLNDKLEKTQEEGNDLEKHTEDAFLCHLLPKPVLSSAQKAMVEVGACLAEVQVVLTDGWEGGPKTVIDRVAAAYEKGW